jgi:hypothetical protein
LRHTTKSTKLAYQVPWRRSIPPILPADLRQAGKAGKPSKQVRFRHQLTDLDRRLARPQKRRRPNRRYIPLMGVR